LKSASIKKQALRIAKKRIDKLFAKEYNENEDTENVLTHDNVDIDLSVNQIDFNINDSHVNHDIDDNNNHCFHNSSGVSVEMKVIIVVTMKSVMTIVKKTCHLICNWLSGV